MYFPSKRDIWFFLMFWGFILFILIIYILDLDPFGVQLITYNSIFGIIITALIIGLLVWVWFRTGYKVEEGFIKIYYGPFRKTVRIEEINKLTKIKSPFTAPALSINRIEILYAKYNSINISPKNENEFIQLLLTVNSNIVLDEKLKKL